MARVILFGGGDGGGIIIGSKGVRPIPPFDPSIRLQLRGLSSLLQGISQMSSKSAREMSTLTNRVSNLVIGQVEQIVGPLDGENAIIYQDEDGGFTCGNTGKPPIPFPWPPRTIPSINDLITSGIVERELIDFINAASAQKLKWNAILENPASAAGRLNLQLSERTSQDLQRLAPSQLEKIADPVDREVVKFFHAVIEDGHHLATWATRPHEVSEKLKFKLSDKAFDRLLAGGSNMVLDPGSKMNPLGAAVVVAVVIMLVPTEAGRTKLSVKDLSGIRKF